MNFKPVHVLAVFALGSTSASAAVEGQDFSGSYQLTDIECYSTSGDLIQSATFLGYTNTITIVGNHYASFESSGSCVASTSGRIVFQSGGSTDFSSGTFSVTQQTLTVPAGSCTLDYNLSSSPSNDIVPKTLSNVKNDSGSAPDFSGAFLSDPSSGAVGIAAKYTVSNATSDACFLVYDRI